jgi:hypothetical protein
MGQVHEFMEATRNGNHVLLRTTFMLRIPNISPRNRPGRGHGKKREDRWPYW